jgi:serine/threonine-protein kinase
MGEVRRCTDLKTGRDVALKLLLSKDEASRGVREARFVREARIQAQLEHPAIVPLYDLGALPDHTPYFTMKKLGGRTLADVLGAIAAGDAAAKADYGAQRLLSAFVTCCLAVAFAHERGVVHVDLKPDNIMLGDFGEVYVLDWGAAAVLGEEDSTTRGSTGTLGYMAPERVMGGAAMPDPRSDVWSLGAILFEILTSEPLIRATSERSQREAPLSAEDRLCRRRRPDLDIAPELEQVCVHATATLAERLPSARELAARITRFLEGDRDLALRRKLAASHVERARQAQLDARDAPRDDLDAEALRELSRALALDPENREASRVLMELWVAPPAASPEAERELTKLEARSPGGESRGRLGAGLPGSRCCQCSCSWACSSRSPSP